MGRRKGEFVLKQVTVTVYAPTSWDDARAERALDSPSKPGVLPANRLANVIQQQVEALCLSRGTRVEVDDGA